MLEANIAFLKQLMFFLYYYFNLRQYRYKLKSLCFLFAFVMFIYIQFEACWFVAVTCPALILKAGFRIFSQPGSEPRNPVPWGHSSPSSTSLPFSILVYPSVALETCALFSHFSLILSLFVIFFVIFQLSVFSLLYGRGHYYISSERVGYRNFRSKDMWRRNRIKR